MGQVWLAADQVLGRLVAVKLLRPEYAEHPETLERFRAEARHAGVLNHPHIAQVYDYGPSAASWGTAFPGPGPAPSREPYLVMEYVDGPSLAEVIEREPLTAGFTCDVIAQAAAGLDAAHQAGLVHRDIKPGNLLLTSDGRVKVTDFGIAHAAGSAPITAPGIVMGTSLYMAPERIAGGPGTPASDLYSLGIVMWECLMGQPPFRGPSPDVMAAHLHQALPPLPDWVPPDVCELVARLTAKDPGYRLSDAGLLAAQLRGLELVAARGLSGPEGTRPWPLPAADFPLGLSQAGGLGPAQDLVSPAVGYLSAAVPPVAAGPAGEPRPARELRAAHHEAGDYGAGEQVEPGRVSVLPAGVPGAGDARQREGGLVRSGLSIAADSAPLLATGTADSAAGAGTAPLLAAGTGGVGPGYRRWAAQRQFAAFAVAAVAVAGLVAGGLAASGAFGATPVAEQGSTGRPAAASGPSSGARTYIRVPGFHDQPYATVVSWLNGHGLAERIAWDGHTRLPAGTVIFVSPSGRVLAGSTVTITVAWSPGEPPPAGIVTGQPGTVSGASASPPSSSPGTTGAGATQPGEGTWPGVASSQPVAATTAPAATQPATGTPATGSAGTGATPTPTPSCVVPVGPVCF